MKKSVEVVKSVESVAPKEFKRTATGIPGFDDLVEGGFPENSAILVAGGPGTGKTILCLQYLINGAEMFDEKGLYITFEQKSQALREQSHQFGWNLEELEKKGAVEILSIPVSKISSSLIADIQEKVKKNKIKRLVIDSLSTLVVNAPIYQSTKDISAKEILGDNVLLSPPIIGDYMVRRFVYSFIESLRELNCTTLLIGEAAQSGESITRDTLSEFACDGIIMISFESMGGAYSRSLIVRKMRQTKNDEDVHPVEISKTGIIVHKIE